MKIRSIYLTGVIAMLLLSVACGGGNEETTTSNPSEDSKNEESQKKEEQADETQSDKETTAAIASGEIMNPNIAEESQGNVEEVYTSESNLDYVHDMDGFKVSIDQYQIVKVTDMSENMYIQFDDQTEGYVVTAKVTIDNTRDKPIYYPSYIRIQGVNEGDFLSSEKTFVREQYPTSKVEDEPTKFGAGEKVSGLITFTLTNDQYDVMTDVKPKFVIEGGASDNDQFKDSFKGNATFDLIYGEEQKAQVESEAGLYPDQLTTGNMADKEMIFEKSGIDETKQLGDVEVTLNGIQYADIKPTAGNEERFSNFGDVGIVAVTVKFTLNNQSDSPINTSLLSSHLLIDEDRGSVLSQLMVEPREPKEIKASETGEKYHVFMFRKDDFDSMKKFDLEFGPFVGEDGKDLYKGKTVTFSLPR
jgi:Domain of unknown function (DUF5068)